MSPPNSAANLNRFLLPFNPMAPIYVKTQRDIDKNTNTSHHIKPTIQKLPQPTSGNRSKPSSLHLKPVRPLSSPTPCLRSAATRSAKPWGGGGAPTQKPDESETTSYPYWHQVLSYKSSPLEIALVSKQPKTTSSIDSANQPRLLDSEILQIQSILTAATTSYRICQ